MDKILETSRLYFKRFSAEDAAEMYRLNLDPEVVRYTGDRAFASIDEAKTFIQNYDHYDRYGYGRWSIFLKSNKQYLGWCGLKYHDEGYVDIGFRFHKAHWGKGYATESAQAALSLGFNVLGLKEIVGRVAEDNLASIRVLEKLGMEYWKRAVCHGIVDAMYYRISSEPKRKK